MKKTINNVGFALLNGSETWCRGEREVTTTRRAERVKVRAMCEANLGD